MGYPYIKLPILIKECIPSSLNENYICFFRDKYIYFFEDITTSTSHPFLMRLHFYDSLFHFLSSFVLYLSLHELVQLHLPLKFLTLYFFHLLSHWCTNLPPYMVIPLPCSHISPHLTLSFQHFEILVCHGPKC